MTIKKQSHSSHTLRAIHAKQAGVKAEPTSSPPAKTSVQTLAVTEDEEGLRLDRWFKRRFPMLALSHLAKIARKGEVRVDGKRVETSTRLSIGQKIRVPPLELRAPTAPAVHRAKSEDAEALRKMTLFEDKDVLVLNKPYGLAVQGGSGTTRHIDGMLASLENAHGQRPVLAHRLDRDTSGVLLIAKTRRIAADLGEAFRSRSAKKIYWALVEGIPRPARGRISLYLAKGAGMEKMRGGNEMRELEKMRVSRHGEEDAQHSLTYYATIEKRAPRCAWLSMAPMTGRTHQLRAHAEAIGHPIFGDPKYGGDNHARANDPLRAMPDQLERKLHLLAHRLILPHPRGGVIDATAPLPEHMAKSWEVLGFDANMPDPVQEELFS